MSTFEAWFAELLGQRELEVKRLMKNDMAIRFLIVWSMFEGRCFKESANEQTIRELADRLVTQQEFDPTCLSVALVHFHTRYQDSTILKKLMSGRKSTHFAQFLNQPVNDLSLADRTFLVMFVVFRYRNNIFHGNKGVESWLKYEDQIRLCTEAMQAIISHVEAFKRKSAA